MIFARTAARALLPQISQRSNNRTANLVWRISALCFANKTWATLFAIAIKACWRWRQQTGEKRMVRKTEIFSLILDANYPRRCRHWLVFNYSSLLLHSSTARRLLQGSLHFQLFLSKSFHVPFHTKSFLPSERVRVWSSDGKVVLTEEEKNKKGADSWAHSEDINVTTSMVERFSSLVETRSLIPRLNNSPFEDIKIHLHIPPILHTEQRSPSLPTGTTTWLPWEFLSASIHRSISDISLTHSPSLVGDGNLFWIFYSGIKLNN